MALTKARREINKNKLKMGKIANLLAGISEDDDEDFFTGLEGDEDELEENETVLDDC